MRRFFVEKIEAVAGTAIIQGNLHHHLAKVLRIKVGQTIILADGTGKEYEAEIASVTGDAIAVTLTEKMNTVAEEKLKISLLQGLPKGDKMELIIQKTTELGIASIIPFVGSRSIPRLSPQKEQDRVDRWRKIALEAARQSKRPGVPQVSQIRNYEQALLETRESVKLILWEEEKSVKLRDFIATTGHPGDAAILIGPEGGFTEEEVVKATRHGFVPVTLGSRILRTETAGLAAVAILQYLWGDLG